MNHFQKSFAMLLSFAVLVTATGGCGSKSITGSENESGSESQISQDELSDNLSGTDGESAANGDLSQISAGTSAGTKSTTKSTSSASTGNFIADPSSSKIVRNKITINMFVPKSTIQSDWENMVLFKEMEKRTNIHIEFEENLLTSYGEKRSLKWEDRKNPTDAFFLANSMSETILLAQSGALTPLNDLIDKYAPNYKKWMQKYPQIRKITTLGDGKMYSFCSINTQGGEAAKQYINKTWLDNLGLKVPTNINEFYNVLKAFKEQNPNGKNGKDEIPFSFMNADQTRNFVMSAFGYVTTGIELDPVTKKIVWVPSTNNYREYLKFMNKLYKEGLIDPYVFTNQSADLAVKGMSEQLGCFSTAAAFLIVGDKLDKDYTSFGPLTSSVNSKKMWYQYGQQFDPSLMIIPKSTKYAKEIVRWIDAFYDETTVPLQSNGIENVNWKWNDSSKNAWSFLVPSGMEREQYRATITYQAGLGGAVLLNGFSLKDSSPAIIKINKEAAVYTPYLRTNLPVLQYTSLEARQIADIEAQFNSFLSTAEANFIKGNTDPNKDSDWNSFMSTQSKIGYKKLQSLYQSAYDRYAK